MSTPEVDAAQVRAVTTGGAAADGPTRRRIRHDARDGFSVAALTLGASVGVSALLWVVLQWLA
jgi:hypothetical protein